MVPAGSSGRAKEQTISNTNASGDEPRLLPSPRSRAAVASASGWQCPGASGPGCSGRRRHRERGWRAAASSRRAWRRRLRRSGRRRIASGSAPHWPTSPPPRRARSGRRGPSAASPSPQWAGFAAEIEGSHGPGAQRMVAGIRGGLAATVGRSSPSSSGVAPQWPVRPRPRGLRSDRRRRRRPAQRQRPSSRRHQGGAAVARLRFGSERAAAIVASASGPAPQWPGSASASGAQRPCRRRRRGPRRGPRRRCGRIVCLAAAGASPDDWANPQASLRRSSSEGWSDALGSFDSHSLRCRGARGGAAAPAAELAMEPPMERDRAAAGPAGGPAERPSARMIAATMPGSTGLGKPITTASRRCTSATPPLGVRTSHHALSQGSPPIARTRRGYANARRSAARSASRFAPQELDGNVSLSRATGCCTSRSASCWSASSCCSRSRSPRARQLPRRCADAVTGAGSQATRPARLEPGARGGRCWSGDAQADAVKPERSTPTPRARRWLGGRRRRSTCTWYRRRGARMSCCRASRSHDALDTTPSAAPASRWLTIHARATGRDRRGRPGGD